MIVAIHDELVGKIMPVGTARFSATSITIRELIRARVELEIEGRHDPSALGTGWRNEAGHLAGSDPTNIIAAAEQGFERGRYFVLVDERQAESLDERVDLARTSEATFLMITPLQGG